MFRTLYIGASLLALILAFTLPAADAEARKGKKKRKSTKSSYYRCRHEVLPGENLGQISKRYRTTAKRLRAINRIKGNSIKAGRKLGIVSAYPCRTRRKVKYTVRKGDTLGKVARKYKMKLRLLKRLNRSARKYLRPGQRLVIVVEGPPPGGKVSGMHRLVSAPGYKVRNGKRAWGTFLTINGMIDVLSAHHRAYPDGYALRIDDLSREGGGYLKPHKSHRTGRDIDIRYPLKTGNDKYVRANGKNLDLPRAWDLLHGFLKTNDIIYLFVDYRLQKLLYAHALKQKIPAATLKKWFQYPRGKKVLKGIIRHEPGHATHVHVRFRKMTADEKKPTS